MTEITADNINNLITNDVKQFMKTVKPRKERTERQKENDVKLKERLTEYHKKKKQTKEDVALQHIQDTLEQLQEQKEIEEMIQIVDEPAASSLVGMQPVVEVIEVVKASRGRPKKHNHPPATTEIKEIRSIDNVCGV